MHGKIMVVTFSDSEEHIIQKIMDVLMVEPVMAHPLEKSLTSNILTSGTSNAAFGLCHPQAGSDL